MRIKQGGVRKHYRTGGHARKLNRVQKKEVKRIVANKEEIKFWDTSSNYQQVDRLGLVFNLFTPARGTGSSDRVGDQTAYKRLDLRMSVYFNGGITGSSNHVFRCILFKWTDDSTVNTPVIADILQFPGGAGDYRAVVSPYAFIAKKVGYYQILYDQVWSIGEGSSLLAKRINKALRGKMNFAGNTTTGEGSIYLLVVCDDASGAHTPDLQFQYASRITYTDA